MDICSGIEWVWMDTQYTLTRLLIAQTDALRQIRSNTKHGSIGTHLRRISWYNPIPADLNIRILYLRFG